MNRDAMERISLGSEAYLNFVENDRYKTNYISFYFVTPLTKENASYNSLLSRVLTRGSEKYPTQLALNCALDGAFDAELDSDTTKVGEWHALCLSLCTLDDAYAFPGETATGKGLEILEEVLRRPYLPQGVFDGEYVKSEKKRNLDDLASIINNKARYARSRMFEHMCRLEPYSISSMGVGSVLRSITPESLTAYYRRLLETARIEIFFVGRFDRVAATEKVKGMLKGLKRTPATLPQPSIRTKARSVREVTEKMDITQANLVMGFRTGTTVYDEDARAMSVYNAVLGGSLTSKLFCVLREKMSLCYSVSSSPDAMKGVMLIYAGIAPENRDVAVKEALNQMDEIRRGNVTDEEMESARGALIHAMRGLGDNPAVLAEWYLPRVLAERIVTPEQIIREVEKIQKEDVIRVSEKITLDTIYTLTAKEEKA
ncbi:MAG: insulinase family protein [Clostridia bacterium]|nr:insulinase family protein [Clostridia bacterium]